MTALLKEGEYELDGFIFGKGNNHIYIQNTAIDPGTATVQDTTIPGLDGIQFGIDTMAGLQITFTGNIYVPPHAPRDIVDAGNIGLTDYLAGNGPASQVSLGGPSTNFVAVTALDAYNQLAAKWNDPTVRLAYNKVVALRMRYPFSDSTRVLYGRGRKIMPTLGFAHSGVVPFVATFQSGDWAFYQDISQSVTLTMHKQPGRNAPPFTGPNAPPFSSTSQDGRCINTGTLGTWPIIQFNGPCQNPELHYTDAGIYIGLKAFLASGDHLIIDTRPWTRFAAITQSQAQSISSAGIAQGGQVASAASLNLSTQYSSNFGDMWFGGAGGGGPANAGNIGYTTGVPPPGGGGGGGGGGPQGGQPVAGLLTGNRMADMQLPPGATKVRFTTKSNNGRGKCIITWQSAEAMIGGYMS